MVHDWKSCVGQNSTVGSNPTLSASPPRTSCFRELGEKQLEESNSRIDRGLNDDEGDLQSRAGSGDSGEVPEWSIGAVSKTVDRSRGPWVRIPPSPPERRPATSRMASEQVIARAKGKSREEDVSAEQPSAKKDPWLSVADEHEERTRGPVTPTAQGTQASYGLSFPAMSERPRAAAVPVMSSAGERLRPEDRLRKRRDFQACYEHGWRIHGEFLTLFGRDNASGRPRMGVTASRRVGGSVCRHQLKRRVKEIYRRSELRATLPAIDLVVHLKPHAAKASFEELRSALRDQLVRATARRTRR